MTIPFLVTPACAVPTFWAGLHYITICITLAGTYTNARLRLLLFAYRCHGFRTVWTALCCLVLLLRLASSHHVTVTLRRTLAGTSSCVRWLLYFSPVVIRWPAGTLARPLGSILPALHRGKVCALPRTLDAKDLRGETAFTVSIEFTVPALRQLVNSFFSKFRKKKFPEPRRVQSPALTGWMPSRPQVLCA